MKIPTFTVVSSSTIDKKLEIFPSIFEFSVNFEVFLSIVDELIISSQIFMIEVSNLYD